MQFNHFWLTITFIFVSNLGLRGQEYEEISRRYSSEFDKLSAKTAAEFDTKVKDADKKFVLSLRNNWLEYNVNQRMKAPSIQKSERIASFDANNSTIATDVKLKAIEHNEISNRAKSKYSSFEPLIGKIEPEEFSTQSVAFTFYGQKISIKYDAKFIKSLPNMINDQTVADFWQAMSTTNHYRLINNLLGLKNTLNLNDWAYLKLVSAFTDQIAANQNTSKLLTWFLMSKTGYKVKIARNNQSLFLLFACQNSVYEKPYITINSENYFLLEPFYGSLTVYPQDYPAANYAINLALNSPPNLGNETIEQKLSFEYNGNIKSFDIKHNQAYTAFLADYPKTNFKVYLDAAASSELKESLFENLKPLLSERTKEEAINLLLQFVQTGFVYKNDGVQFGYDKCFFTEEVFHYPFSDSEDRVVLLAYLLKELLNIEVLAVEIPGRIALAVRTESAKNSVRIKNKDYLIIDPNYSYTESQFVPNAFINSELQTITVENANADRKKSSELWKVLNLNNLLQSNPDGNIIKDKANNWYATGFLIDEAKVNQSGTNEEQFLGSVFIAKYNETKQLVWLKTLKTTGRATGQYIALDDLENPIISGKFTGKLTTEGQTLKALRNDIFTAKFSPDGNVEWVVQLGLSDYTTDKDYVYSARISNDGKLISKLIFPETDNFNQYGLQLADSETILLNGTMVFEGQSLAYEFVNDSSRDAFKIMSKAETDMANYLALNIKAENLPELWKKEVDQLIVNEYNKNIAGLFAFLKTVKLNGYKIDGKTLQAAIDSYNPEFKKIAPGIYKMLSSLEFVINSGGIITVNTISGEDLIINNLIVLEHDAKLRVTTFSTGNAQIDFLKGVSLGKTVYGFGLNSIKLFKNSEDLVFDYDINHSLKTYNLKRDLLK